MATWLLGICIFGFAGWVIYRQIKRGGGSCESCNHGCPVKSKMKK